MNVSRAHLKKEAKIGKGEPKRTLVPERDGVTLELRGDWLIVVDIERQKGLAIPQTSIDYCEFEPSSDALAASAAAGGKRR